jgi:hypothetical protein
MLTKGLLQKKETITIRTTSKTLSEIDRLAFEKGMSRNKMCSELIEAGVAFFKDMTPLQNAINTSKGFFDDLQLDKLVENLKDIPMTFYRKAYLANKLTIEQRTELFKKLNFNDEQNEAYTIDKVLSQSKEKGITEYNYHLIANSLTIILSDFGREYLSWHIGDEGLEKLKQVKPSLFPTIDVDLSDEISEEGSGLSEFEKIARKSLPEVEVK